MINWGEGRRDYRNRLKKISLIRALYVYPLLFFFIGMSMIFLYYTIIQIRNYNKQVEKTRTEFPEIQRNELRQKVLILKDYIYWVKSHPDEYIINYINKKFEISDSLMRFFQNEKTYINNSFSPSLTESLDKLNIDSSVKILILNANKELVFPEKHENPAGLKKTILPAIHYKHIDFSQVDTVIKQLLKSSLSKHPLLFIKSYKSKGIYVGITFNADQETSILQEVILDSISKVKYRNNEYAFINTYSGYALLSRGQRQIPPINIRLNAEATWQSIFNKQLEFVKQKEGGYYTYFWRNQPQDERTEKTSYFSGITDWEWIIGTGFFANDIDPIIDQMNDELWKDIIGNLIRFLVFLSILSLVAFIIIRHFANEAKSNILQFLYFFKRASSGIQIIDTSNLAFSEFDTLAHAANRMIQERERIKSVLSAEKSRLKYMIDAIPDLIFFKDAESKFLGCNTAFEKYINKKSEEIAGLTEFDLFPELEAEGFVEQDKEILFNSKPQRSTNWVEYPNGQRCLYYTLKTPYFDSNHNLLGIIGISRDITEMEETRQRLMMAKEKAEESDQLKTAFLANMSHEIRTPMNAIIGFSDLLGDDSLSKNEKADFISKIKNSGTALMALINDIMDIAKIEAGQLNISESACDVHIILNDLYDSFEELRKKSDKNDIQLKLTVPENNSKLLIITDPIRLRQVLTNILSNALKFTETGTIEFGYSIEKENLSFFVKDTGIGILQSKQKFLFQRFSQVDTSSTRKYGGAGLGLAIAKNLIDLLGGTIGMESKPGVGSLFYFTLPYKPLEPKAKKNFSQITHEINWRGKTILIAEDIMQNFILLQALLRYSHVKLLHALNGQIAIDTVKSEPEIDLILMDIQLPVKTGYEALDEIIKIRPDIPIMSYTAFALPHEREKSLAAGFVEFIPKPIKAETLIPLLDKYLRNQG